MKKKFTTVKGIFQFTAVWLLFSTILFSQMSAKAQGSTSSGVKGYVLNNLNEPLAGATITATYLPSNSRFVVKATTKGAFNLQNLPVGGPYTIEITSIGNKKYTENNLSLPLGQVYTMKVFLEEENQQLNRRTEFDVIVNGVNITQQNCDDK